MFAGGSGIAPFRSFWEARAYREGCGRNLLFFGVRTCHTFLYETEIRYQVRNGNLEAHIAFSQDCNRLVYDRHAKYLVEKTMEPRYIDSAILDEGADLCDIITPTEMGGLGGYIYICGSASLYETVSRTLLKVLSMFTKNGEGLLARAFVERRVMLDVFMAPRSISISQPVITLAELARNTGHTENGRVWIGTHGCVYDVTDFLPVHPSGRLIVAASAGLDATHTFDLVAHTNNGEVRSLLSKYFIGHLAPKPHNFTKEIADLWDSWAGYLRTCVESLTTLSLEANLIQDRQAWFTNGRLDICVVRKFYQFQSRFMQSSMLALFGPTYLCS
jgi:cytochrome b involved in lipid metabolism